MRERISYVEIGVRRPLKSFVRTARAEKRTGTIGRARSRRTRRGAYRNVPFRSSRAKTVTPRAPFATQKPRTDAGVTRETRAPRDVPANEIRVLSRSPPAVRATAFQKPPSILGRPRPGTFPDRTRPVRRARFFERHAFVLGCDA